MASASCDSAAAGTQGCVSSNTADSAAAARVNANAWPGHYTMFPPSEQQRQKALDVEASELMKKPRWEHSIHLKDRFDAGLSSAEIGTMVSKLYYRQSGYAAKVFSSPGSRPIGYALTEAGRNELVTPYGVVLLRRRAANNRDEGVTRDQYEHGMSTCGYSATSRTPTILL